MNKMTMLEWLDDVVKCVARQDEQHDFYLERKAILDEMLNDYIEDLASQKSSHLSEILEYLRVPAQKQEFLQAFNIVNLLVMMSFQAESDVEFDRGMRFCLMHSRQDSSFSRTMKLYYLDNLSRDEFSGIVNTDEEYAALQKRMNLYRSEYIKFVSSAQ